jgi:hypothetical protein
MASQRRQDDLELGVIGLLLLGSDSLVKQMVDYYMDCFYEVIETLRGTRNNKE